MRQISLQKKEAAFPQPPREIIPPKQYEKKLMYVPEYFGIAGVFGLHRLVVCGVVKLSLSRDTVEDICCSHVQPASHRLQETEAHPFLSPDPS